MTITPSRTDNLEVKAAGDTLTVEELTAALAGRTGPIRLFVTDGSVFEPVCITGIAHILPPPDDEPEAGTGVIVETGPYFGCEHVAVAVEAAPAIRALAYCWDSAIAAEMRRAC